MSIPAITGGAVPTTPPPKKTTETPAEEPVAPAQPIHPVMTLIEHMAKVDKSGELVDELA